MLSKTDLGRKVRDKVTGFTGIATSWHDKFDGAPQIGISPPVDDKGNNVEALCFDVAQVEAVESKIHRTIEAVPPAPHSFNLGDEVRDTISGFVGKITDFTTFLNGCVYVQLQPQTTKNEFPDRVHLPINRVELKNPVKAPTEPPRRGGPVTRAPRRD